MNASNLVLSDPPYNDQSGHEAANLLHDVSGFWQHGGGGDPLQTDYDNKVSRPSVFFFVAVWSVIQDAVLK